jgi:cell division septum initiation protein DivIVA
VSLTRAIAELPACDESEDMSNEFESQAGLPVGFRGYRRKETDAYVAGLHQHYTTLLREKGELQRQVDSLNVSVKEHEERANAVAEALVTAQLIAADLRAGAESDIERERNELAVERQRLVDEAAATRAEAHQVAAEIVREARVRGDRLVEEVLSSLDEYQRETDQYLGGKRERLGSLVRDLLARIPGSAPAPPPEEHDEHAEHQERTDSTAASAAA